MRFVFDDVEIDDATLELRRGGVVQSVQVQSLELVLYLIRNRDRVVSHDELHGVLWPGQAIGETSLGQAVRRARRVIGDDGGQQRLVRNVRRRGYRFVAEIKEIDPAEGVREPEAEAASLRSRRAPAIAGRSRELDELMTALEQAHGGMGDACWIRGDAGIGKSHLLRELRARAGASGVRALSGGCRSGGWAPSYAPFSEMLAAEVRRLEPERLGTRLAESASVLASLVPGMEALGAAGRDEQPRAPAAERGRLFAAITDFLAELAGAQTLLILLDDLHWADAGTLELALHVAGVARASGWLLVGAYRRSGLRDDAPLALRLADLNALSERRAPMELRGLDVGETGAMLHDFLGRELPLELVSGIQERTLGNPFFSREYLRHFLDEGLLVSDDGRWGGDFAIADLPLPEGVREVLAQRVSDLVPETVDLLASASAMAGPFRFEIVRRATRLDEESALAALDDALDRGILAPAEGSDEYAFTHSLMQEVIYEGQSPARRARQHRRLAESLVEVYAGRADEHADEIAREYGKSAELPGAEAALPFCLKAADRAESVANLERVADCLELALKVASTTDPRRRKILEWYGFVLALSGPSALAAQTVSEAARLLAEAESPEAGAAYLADVVEALNYRASDLGRALSEHGLQLADGSESAIWGRLRLVDLSREAGPGAPSDSPDRRAATRAVLEDWHELEPTGRVALAYAGLIFESREELLRKVGDTPDFLVFWGGRFEQALALLEEETRAIEPGPYLERGYFALTHISRLHSALGDPAAARAALARAEQLTVDYPGFHRAPPHHMVHASSRAELALTEGEGFAALAPVFVQLATADAGGVDWLIPTVMCVGAEILARAGENERARAFLLDGLPGLVRSPAWMLTTTLMANAAAGALWSLGWTDWTSLVKDQLLEKPLATDFRTVNTDSRLSMARLCVLQQEWDEAGEWFERAREALDAERARSLRAVVDHDEAKSLLQRGRAADRARAHELLAGAAERFRTLGMPGWHRSATTLS